MPHSLSDRCLAWLHQHLEQASARERARRGSEIGLFAHLFYDREAASRIDDPRALTMWHVFESAWRWEEGADKRRARKVFKGLIAGVQAAAVRYAPLYIAACDAARRPPVPAARWLEQEGYKSFYTYARAA